MHHFPRRRCVRSSSGNIALLQEKVKGKDAKKGSRWLRSGHIVRSFSKVQAGNLSSKPQQRFQIVSHTFKIQHAAF